MPPSLAPPDVTDVGAVASELLGQNTLGQCRGAYLDNLPQSISPAGVLPRTIGADRNGRPFTSRHPAACPSAAPLGHSGGPLTPSNSCTSCLRAKFHCCGASHHYPA